jgi:hypothetical protein
VDQRSRELVRQFLAWVAAAPRTYDDVIGVWRSTCPRLSILEDALDDGMIRFDRGVVRITDDGAALLRDQRAQHAGAPPERAPRAPV